MWVFQITDEGFDQFKVMAWLIDFTALFVFVIFTIATLPSADASEINATKASEINFNTYVYLDFLYSIMSLRIVLFQSFSSLPHSSSNTLHRVQIQDNELHVVADSRPTAWAHWTRSQPDALLGRGVSYMYMYIILIMSVPYRTCSCTCWCLRFRREIEDCTGNST